jgi:uncharacterized membrane protein SirB2
MLCRLAGIDFGGQNPRLPGLCGGFTPMYLTLKTIHISFATLSIAGFVLRGIWMFRNDANLDRSIVRILPHVVDTAFLITGIWMVVILQIKVMQQDWLIAKIVALVLYVLLGAIALRHGRSIQIRTASFIAALTTYLYIVGVALHKSPASWLA